MELALFCWYACFGMRKTASPRHPMPFSRNAEILGGNGCKPAFSGLPYPFNRYFASDKQNEIWPDLKKRSPLRTDKQYLLQYYAPLSICPASGPLPCRGENMPAPVRQRNGAPSDFPKKNYNSSRLPKCDHTPL